MLYYLKKYPFSLLVIGAVLYLSLFKPPAIDVPLFSGIDKLVHFCMYGGLAGMLWVEFLWNHRKDTIPVKRGIIGATICPVLFGGVVELIQEYFTSYRGGDWWDFLANTSGALTAAIIAWYIIRPFIVKRFGNIKE